MTPQQETMWGNLSLRMRAFASRQCRGRGLAVITVRLLVSDGDLFAWGEPEASFFEPRGECSEQVAALLSLVSASGVLNIST